MVKLVLSLTRMSFSLNLNPNQIRSMKLSVCLPQSAYAFEVDMRGLTGAVQIHSLTNSPYSKHTRHTSLVHISFFATCTMFYFASHVITTHTHTHIHTHQAHYKARCLAARITREMSRDVTSQSSLFMYHHSY